MAVLIIGVPHWSAAVIVGMLYFHRLTRLRIYFMRISIIQNCMIPPAIIWQKPSFSNEEALSLVRRELGKILKDKEADKLMSVVKSVCKRLNIQPRNLPINATHQGNLTAQQSCTLYEEIFNTTVFNRKA